MTMGGAPVKGSHPNVTANLAPPSYCITSATVNRLATRTNYPKSVPKSFWPNSLDLLAATACRAYESDRRDHNSRELAGRTFRVLQRQSQFLRQVIDRRSLPLPCAIGFEPECADTPAPRRNDTSDGTEVGAIGVMLIDLLNHVRRDANERAQCRRRSDAVFAPVPRRFKNARDLLEIVDEKLLRLFAELFALAGAAESRFVGKQFF